jgi:hypothetical protein
MHGIIGKEPLNNLTGCLGFLAHGKQEAQRTFRNYEGIRKHPRGRQARRPSNSQVFTLLWFE